MVENSAYEVSAYLRVHGNFAQQMQRNAGVLPRFDASMVRAGQHAQIMGQRIMGTSLQTAAAYGKMSAAVAGFAGAAGMGVAVHNGLAFNKAMEDARLQVGAMFQMFGFNTQIMGENVSAAEQWNANIGLAKDTMDELYGIAKQSPASFRDVTLIYQNAAAGLAAASDDVADHLEFMKKASLLGGLAGGDYNVLGSQIGRIVAGSAGAEMNIWKSLAKPILEAGQNMGIFAEDMGYAGGEMTQAFNQLTSAQRLDILMEAMKTVGPEVSKTFAESMSGIMSTTRSAFETITGGAAQQMYERFRERLIRLNSEGGLLGGESLRKFEDMSTILGSRLADGADHLLDAVERGAIFMRDNWEDVIARLSAAFDTAVTAGKLMIAAGVARTAAGGTLAAAGVGMQGLGQLGHLAGTVGSLGSAAGIAVPLIAAAGIAISGIGVVFGGLGAYFVDNWEIIADAIKNGTVHLYPLTIALETMWAKMVAMGGAFLGTSDPVEAVNMLINLFAEGVNLLSDSMLVALKIIEAMVMAYALMARYGPHRIVGAIVDIVAPGSPIADHIDSLAGGAENLAGRMGDAAYAFDHASMVADSVLRRLGRASEDADFTSKQYAQQLVGISEEQRKQIAQGKEVFGASMLGMMTTRDLKQAKKEDEIKKIRKTGVTINRLEMINDFRDTDPDRVLSAIMQPLERMASKRVHSWETLDEGD